MELIAGTYRLLSLEARSKDHGAMFPLGRDVRGVVIYGGDGYMSGMISGENRPNVTSPALAGMSKEEREAIAKTFIAYAGKYTVRDGWIIHDVEVSFIPNLMGGPSHIHSYRLDGDTLTITPRPVSMNMKRTEVILTWKKA